MKNIHFLYMFPLLKKKSNHVAFASFSEWHRKHYFICFSGNRGKVEMEARHKRLLKEIEREISISKCSSTLIRRCSVFADFQFMQNRTRISILETKSSRRIVFMHRLQWELLRAVWTKFQMKNRSVTSDCNVGRFFYLSVCFFWWRITVLTCGLKFPLNLLNVRVSYSMMQLILFNTN